MISGRRKSLYFDDNIIISIKQLDWPICMIFRSVSWKKTFLYHVDEQIFHDDTLNNHKCDGSNRMKTWLNENGQHNKWNRIRRPSTLWRLEKNKIRIRKGEKSRRSSVKSWWRKLPAKMRSWMRRRSVLGGCCQRTHVPCSWSPSDLQWRERDAQQQQLEQQVEKGLSFFLTLIFFCSSDLLGWPVRCVLVVRWAVNDEQILHIKLTIGSMDFAATCSLTSCTVSSVTG